MARIDTLGHFLTDVADAIREKTGDTNPINASDFDTVISNIKGGLDIQNGRLVNYKATSGTVPEGTFVKLNTVYNTSDVRTLNGESSSTSYSYHYTSSLIHLRDDIYCYEGGDGNGGKLYTVRVTENGIIKYAEPFSMGAAWGENRCLVRLSDDTVLFAHSPSNAMSACIVKLNTNNVWNIVKSDFYLMGESYRSCNGVYMTEDADYWYIHVNDSSGSIRMNRISKLDYTNTQGTTKSGIGSGYSGFIKLLNTNTLFIGSGYSYAILTFDTANLTYNRIKYGNVSLSGTRPLWQYINGKYVVLGLKTINDINHLVLQEIAFDSSYNASVVQEVDLGINTSSMENSWGDYGYLALTPVSDTALIYISQSLNSPDRGQVNAQIINVDNTIGFGQSSLITTIHDVGFGNYPIKLCAPITQSLINKFLLVCGYTIGFYTIDNALNINQESGSAITVAPAINEIIGITTTECTDTTAGDVYVLDA